MADNKERSAEQAAASPVDMRPDTYRGLAGLPEQPAVEEQSVEPEVEEQSAEPVVEVQPAEPEERMRRPVRNNSRICCHRLILCHTYYKT